MKNGRKSSRKIIVFRRNEIHQNRLNKTLRAHTEFQSTSNQILCSTKSDPVKLPANIVFALSASSLPLSIHFFFRFSPVAAASIVFLPVCTHRAPSNATRVFRFSEKQIQIRIVLMDERKKENENENSRIQRNRTNDNKQQRQR